MELKIPTANTSMKSGPSRTEAATAIPYRTSKLVTVPGSPIWSIQKTLLGWFTASSFLSAKAFTTFVAAVTRPATTKPSAIWNGELPPASMKPSMKLDSNLEVSILLNRALPSRLGGGNNRIQNKIGVEESEAIYTMAERYELQSQSGKGKMPTVDRTPTGIPGLDEILSGGFP